MRTFISRGLRGTMDASRGAYPARRTDDPPALVHCPYCDVVVRADRRKYLDANDDGSYCQHRHQPRGSGMNDVPFDVDVTFEPHRKDQRHHGR